MKTEKIKLKEYVYIQAAESSISHSPGNKQYEVDELFEKEASEKAND